MKKRLGILAAAIVAMLVFSLSTSAFFGFGYTHGIPANDSKLFAGFNFGPVGSEFNLDFYLADLWTTAKFPPDNKTDICLGVEAFYVGATNVIEVEVGTYFESNPLYQWPTVGLNEVGFYGDLIVHVLPQTYGGVIWDLFASFDLIVNGTNLELEAEVGFEVEL